MLSEKCRRNMKTMKIIGVTIIQSGIFLLLYKPLLYFAAWGGLKANHAASIGIIGGADGPTAVFVASSFSLGMSSLLLFFFFSLIINWHSSGKRSNRWLLGSIVCYVFYLIAALVNFSLFLSFLAVVAVSLFVVGYYVSRKITP